MTERVADVVRWRRGTSLKLLLWLLWLGRPLLSMCWRRLRLLTVVGLRRRRRAVRTPWLCWVASRRVAGLRIACRGRPISSRRRRPSGRRRSVLPSRRLSISTRWQISTLWCAIWSGCTVHVLMNNNLWLYCLTHFHVQIKECLRRLRHPGTASSAACNSGCHKLPFFDDPAHGRQAHLVHLVLVRRSRSQHDTYCLHYLLVHTSQPYHTGDEDDEATDGARSTRYEEECGDHYEAQYDADEADDHAVLHPRQRAVNGVDATD